jgi:hypothetical protein
MTHACEKGRNSLSSSLVGKRGNKYFCPLPVRHLIQRLAKGRADVLGLLLEERYDLEVKRGSHLQRVHLRPMEMPSPPPTATPMVISMVSSLERSQKKLFVDPKIKTPGTRPTHTPKSRPHKPIMRKESTR